MLRCCSITFLCSLTLGHVEITADSFCVTAILTALIRRVFLKRENLQVFEFRARGRWVACEMIHESETFTGNILSAMFRALILVDVIHYNERTKHLRVFWCILPKNIYGSLHIYAWKYFIFYTTHAYYIPKSMFADVWCTWLLYAKVTCLAKHIQGHLHVWVHLCQLLCVYCIVKCVHTYIMHAGKNSKRSWIQVRLYNTDTRTPHASI